MSGPIGSGLAFPLTVDERGGIALARGEDEIEQAIRIILSTAPGERPMRPEFGCAVHDYVFDGIDPTTLGQIEDAIRVALDRWEPRVTLEDVAFDGPHGGRLDIELTYRLNPTNNVRNLVYPLYVVPAEDTP